MLREEQNNQTKFYVSLSTRVITDSTNCILKRYFFVFLLLLNCDIFRLSRHDVTILHYTIIVCFPYNCHVYTMNLTLCFKIDMKVIALVFLLVAPATALLPDLLEK